jgi:hypothetical protein
MPLTIDEVEHIAKLARLELTADKELYRGQLSPSSTTSQNWVSWTLLVPPTAGGLHAWSCASTNRGQDSTEEL